MVVAGRRTRRRRRKGGGVRVAGGVEEFASCILCYTVCVVCDVLFVLCLLFELAVACAYAGCGFVNK